MTLIVLNDLNINLMLLVVGFCNCYAGHTGDDCRVDMESPPEIVDPKAPLQQSKLIVAEIEVLDSIHKLISRKSEGFLGCSI
jgi:hypothetical protein